MEQRGRAEPAYAFLHASGIYAARLNLSISPLQRRGALIDPDSSFTKGILNALIAALPLQKTGTVVDTSMLKATLLSLLAFIVGIADVRAVGTNAELPFELVNGFIFVNARVGQSAKPLTFLLDSGASTSALSLQAARRLRVQLLASQPVQGVGSRSVAHQIRPVAATAGKTLLTEIPFALDLSNAESICGKAVDGLIGMDFFANKIVQIDYAAKRLRLLPRAEQATATQKLPIDIRNGIICVPVGVNGSAQRWVRLDTGCNDALHWVMPGARGLGQQSNESVGFATDESSIMKASVQLGKHTLNSVPVAPHSNVIFPGESGLLGNGILSHYTVTIDTPGRQVLLHTADPKKN